MTDLQFLSAVAAFLISAVVFSIGYLAFETLKAFINDRKRSGDPDPAMSAWLNEPVECRYLGCSDRGEDDRGPRERPKQPRREMTWIWNNGDDDPPTLVCRSCFENYGHNHRSKPCR